MCSSDLRDVPQVQTGRECEQMKDRRGWIALAIFCAACCIIGMEGFLLKKLNPTVLVMLAVAVVVVVVLGEGE